MISYLLSLSKYFFNYIVFTLKTKGKKVRLPLKGNLTVTFGIYNEGTLFYNF